MLKRFVEIEFEICSIYKARYAEENSLLKFTEQFCKMLIAYLSLRSLLKIDFNSISTFENSRTIRVVSFPVEILQNSVANFPEIVEYIIQSRQL